MSLKIMSSVRRAYRATEEYVGVLIKAPTPREELAAAVGDVVDFMQTSSDPLDQATPVEFQTTMSGPAIVLGDVVPSDLQPTLERIAALLAERGIDDVTMTAMPTTKPFGRGKWSMIQAWFGLRGVRPPGWRPLGWPADDPTWQVAPADLNTAIESLVAWALALPGRSDKIAVKSELEYVPVPADVALGMVQRTAALRRRPLANELVVTAGDGRLRWLNLLHWSGSVAAAEGTTGGAPLDWPTALTDIRDLVADAGPWCAYAHVTRAVIMRMTPDNGDRYLGSTSLGELDEPRGLIDAGTLFDAYGIMRLPRELAQRLPLEPDWKTTDLGPDATLAEHRDLEAWYGTRRIRPDTIAEARTRLGDAVIDRTDEWPDPVE